MKQQEANEQTSTNEETNNEETTAQSIEQSIGEESTTSKTPEQQNAELISHIQRLQAEFDNYRKRVQKEKEDNKAQATEHMIKEILPILDNFKLSLHHAKNEHGTINAEELLTGILMVSEQLEQLLEHHGVKPIKTDGEMFNPREHEAIVTIEKAGVARKTVLQTFQQGYMLNGRMLRPAKVSVAK